jgi:tRNA(Ile)-lysidine synthase
MPPQAATLLTKLNADWPPLRWKDVTVIVAVSGGADSVALARGLAELRVPGEGRLLLAHFNHRLRGAESDSDQAFVGQLSAALGWKLAWGVAREDLAENHRGEGLEAAARDARYAFLTEAAAQHGARYVVTAHTADDQAETVLHHVLRGTGISGLAGIRRARPLSGGSSLLRPMLDVTRAEVLEYLQSIHQEYRADSSNDSIAYTRNRIRRQLLPQLERDYNPHVRDALCRLAQIADQSSDYLNRQAQALLERAAEPVQGGVQLNAALFAAEHPAIVRQALLVMWREQRWPRQQMSMDRWEQVRMLIQSQPPTGQPASPRTLPGGVYLTRQENKVLLIRS